jgi:hypothetical protein
VSGTSHLNKIFAQVLCDISSVRFDLEQIQVERYAISLVAVINFRKHFQNRPLLEIRFI